MSLWHVICVCVYIAKASWITSPDPLIRSDDMMSIGVYDDIIYLLGGRDYPTQATQYKISTQTFTNLGATALTASLKGFGQFWTQQNHMIYIIDQSTGNSFCSYDMITNQFETNWMSVTFNTNVDDSACLASTAQHLYVTGGENTDGDILNTVQMLSLSTFQWTSPPNMNVLRKNHACIVHNTYLWAIGGRDCIYSPCPDALRSIERVAITDIINNQWQFVSDLSEPLYGTRVVGWYDTLYVVGGYSQENNMYGSVDSMHLIDADSGDVSLSSYSLPNQCPFTSPIIYDGVLYTFGGMQAVWAYYQLPQHTPLTTDIPTDTPSEIPTNKPSNAPSNIPSEIPTDIPTNKPSNVPSNMPSNIPTVTPKVTPNQSPSQDPTVTPSDNPSKKPTVAPSDSSDRVIEWTISIAPNECLTEKQKQDCQITEDEINEILIAYLDVDGIKLLSTDIVDNKAAIVISVARDSDVLLDKDVIASRMQTELEFTYGNVDVTIKETPEEDNTDTNMNASDATLSFIIPVVVGAVVLFLVILFVLVTSCYCKKSKVVVQSQIHMNDIVQMDAQSANANAKDSIPSTLNTAEPPAVTTDHITMKDVVRAQTLLDWFTHVVELPQYYHLFIQSGYDSFRMVQGIQNEEELRDIGIKKKGHVSVMMSEIEKLQNNELEGGPMNPIQSALAHIGTARGIDIVQPPHFPTKQGDEANIGSANGIDIVQPPHCPYRTKKGDEDNHVAHANGITWVQPPTVTQGNDGGDKVSGEEDVVQHDGADRMGMCTDCAQYKAGRVFDEDGMFYCDACWLNYENLNLYQKNTLHGIPADIPSPGEV